MPVAAASIDTHTRKEVTTRAADNIQGWMSGIELDWIARTAARCLRILEIGCWKGRSTRAFADNMPKGAVLYAVDIWGFAPTYPDQAAPLRDELEARGGDSIFAEFSHNLADHIAAGRVIPVRGDRDVAFALLKGEPAFDLLFIDADHVYDAVVADITTLSPLVKRGGVISGHDHYLLPVATAVRDTIGPPQEIYDTIWVQQRQ